MAQAGPRARKEIAWFYFNLDKRTDRRRTFEAQLKKHALDAIRLPAVDGRRDTRVRALVKRVRRDCCRNLTSHACEKMFTPRRPYGILGLARAWELLAEEAERNADVWGLQPDTVLAVVEDDIILNQFGKSVESDLQSIVANVSARAPNWDTIRLNCYSEGVGTIFANGFVVPTVPRLCPECREYCGGTFVVIVKYAKLSQLANHFMSAPIDDIDCKLFTSSMSNWCVNLPHNAHPQFLEDEPHYTAKPFAEHPKVTNFDSDIQKEKALNKEELQERCLNPDPPLALFYFNLDARPDRAQTFEAQLQKHAPGLDGIRLPAVDGRTDTRVKALVEHVRSDCLRNFTAHACAKMFTPKRPYAILALARSWQLFAEQAERNAKAWGLQSDTVLVVFNDLVTITSPRFEWHVFEIVGGVSGRTSDWDTIRLHCAVETPETSIFASSLISQTHPRLCPECREYCGGSSLIIVKYAKLRQLADHFMRPPYDAIDCKLFTSSMSNWCVNLSIPLASGKRLHVVEQPVSDMDVGDEELVDEVQARKLSFHS